MKQFGPVAITSLLCFLLSAPVVVAKDWDSGRTYYYPPGTSEGDPSRGQARSYDYGDFRPREFTSGQERTQPGGGPVYDRAPQSATAPGGSWNGHASGQWSEPRPTRPDRPLGQYRFRPRADDKALEQSDAPRFRPDADLSRRSQRYWGVPGQDPADYGGAPGMIFRPLRPETDQTVGAAKPDPGVPPALPPALPGYAPWGEPGYYPY